MRIARKGTLNRTQLSCCSKCWLFFPLLFLPKLYLHIISRSLQAVTLCPHTHLPMSPTKWKPLVPCHPKHCALFQCASVPIRRPWMSAQECLQLAHCRDAFSGSPEQVAQPHMALCLQHALWLWIATLRVTMQSFTGQRHQGQINLAKEHDQERNGLYHSFEE